MYRFVCVFAIALSMFGCSDDQTLTVDCARLETQADGVTVHCGDSAVDNSVTDPATEPDAGAPIVLKAGCYQDLSVCPQAFPMSWLVEHCTISYACPAANTPNPDELICLRFIMQDCWDKNSN